jgi:hypothetical protein
LFILFDGSKNGNGTPAAQAPSKDSPFLPTARSRGSPGSEG